MVSQRQLLTLIFEFPQQLFGRFLSGWVRWYTQEFSITLLNEMKAVVKSKVATGDYATESEVIREGLRALMARNRAAHRWLHQSVVVKTSSRF